MSRTNWLNYAGTPPVQFGTSRNGWFSIIVRPSLITVLISLLEKMNWLHIISHHLWDSYLAVHAFTLRHHGPFWHACSCLPPTLTALPKIAWLWLLLTLFVKTDDLLVFIAIQVIDFFCCIARFWITSHAWRCRQFSVLVAMGMWMSTRQVVFWEMQNYLRLVLGLVRLDEWSSAVNFSNKTSKNMISIWLLWMCSVGSLLGAAVDRDAMLGAVDQNQLICPPAWLVSTHYLFYIVIKRIELTFSRNATD